MPPLLAAALVALAPGLGATLVGGVTFASAIAYGITTIAAVGAQFAFNKLTSKKGKAGDPQITQLTIRQPLPTRVRAYGRVKLGGALFFEAAVPVENAPLWLGIIHCEGPIDEFEGWYLNDAITGIPAGSAGGQNLALPWATYVSLESHKGEDFQAPAFLLQNVGWTGNLNGLAYTVMQCQQPYRPDKNFQYYYPNGVPAIRVVVRASKVYDPRTTMDWNTPSTWNWSRNPALIILDYLTFARTDTAGLAIPRGMGLPKSKMNLASFAAFANVCDESMPTRYAYDINGDVILSAGTEPRYACDGAYEMSEAPTEVLNRMLGTCDGVLYTLSDGTIGIRGGKWEAPSVTITDAMILSADFTQGNDRYEAFNHLKISFTCTALDYQVVEGVPWEDLDDEDANGVLSSELELPFVQSHSQARRLAKIHTAKANPRWRFTSLVCNLGALNALGEQFVHVTHSLSGIDDDFAIAFFKLMPGGMTVELQLTSIDSSAFDWNPLTEDAQPPSKTGTINLGGGLGGIGLTSAGGIPTGFVVSITVIGDADVDLGLASDAVYQEEDWGMASDPSYYTADLGLII